MKVLTVLLACWMTTMTFRDVNGNVVDTTQQEIVESPTNTYAKLGENGIVFNCKFKNLKGEPQWCLDDFCLRITSDMKLKGRPRHRIIGNRTNGEYNLLIDNVQLQDNMVYYCLATAASETVYAVKSNKAFLTVLTPPELIQLNNPVHLSLNKATTVECVARRSRPSVKLFLSIDNQLIQTEAKYKTSVVKIPTGSLASDMPYNSLSEINRLPFYEQIKYFYYDTYINVTLDDVSVDLNGKTIECIAYEIPLANYTLSSSFKFKPIMNKISSIQVDYAPEVNLKLKSTSKFIQENDVITFVCESRAMPPVQAYKWYLDNSYINGVNDDKLNLKLRKEMHLQSVTCEATNTVASVKASIQLNIKYKPYFAKPNEEFLLYNKDMCSRQTTLDCQVMSNPQANITWFKMTTGSKMQTIGYGPTYTIPVFNCGLRFENQSDIDHADDDFGLYVCIADNGLVMDNQTNIRNIKINSVGAPSLRLSSDADEYSKATANVKYISMGDDFTLTCIIEPVPTFSKVSWHYNGKKISNSHYINFNQIDGDFNSDDGEYDESLANVEISYVNTTQGLKSQLKSTILTLGDFARYTCKTSNIYGTREISVELKEDSFLTSANNESRKANLKLKFYFLMAVIVFVLLSLFLVAVICIKNCLKLKNKENKKKTKSGRDATILNEDLRDYSLSTNINNESSANSEKTVNDWLITTSPTSSSTASDTISKQQPFIQLANRHMLNKVNDTDDIDEQDRLMIEKILNDDSLVSPKTYYLADLFQSTAVSSPNSSRYQNTSNFKPNIIHSNMKHIPYTTLTRSHPYQSPQADRMKGVKFSDEAINHCLTSSALHNTNRINQNDQTNV